jgi:nitrogen fixation protein FixH
MIHRVVVVIAFIGWIIAVFLLFSNAFAEALIGGL